VTLNFIPRSPDAELVIRAIEPKPVAQADAYASWPFGNDPSRRVAKVPRLCC
jgi:hypothetical protein